MIDIKAKYQAGIFANMETLTPSPDNITSLLQAFRDKEFIPTIFQEINIGSPGVNPRVQLISQDGQWSINFATQRIDIEKNAITGKGENLGDIAAFCEDITDFVSRIRKAFSFKANRLSLVSMYMFEEMSPDVMANVFKKFFNMPPFYTTKDPFEWGWKAGVKQPLNFSGLSENVNVLTSVSRISGQLASPTGVVPFERIQVTFDLNTVAESREYRFEMEHVRDYYQEIKKLHDSILQELDGYIHEQ